MYNECRWTATMFAVVIYVQGPNTLLLFTSHQKTPQTSKGLEWNLGWISREYGL